MSHIWDMCGLAFGTKTDLHGFQCAVATLICVKAYERLKNCTPNRQALKYVKSFDFAKWSGDLRSFVGVGAEAMIEREKSEKKYDTASHAERIERIIGNWDAILEIIDEELPDSREIEKLLDSIGAPKTCAEIGTDPSILPMTFKAAKDIRFKYVLPHLRFDLGIIDEMAETLA